MGVCFSGSYVYEQVTVTDIVEKKGHVRKSERWLLGRYVEPVLKSDTIGKLGKLIKWKSGNLEIQTD